MKIGIDARLWHETGVGRYIRNLVYNLSEIDQVNNYVLFLPSADVKKIKAPSNPAGRQSSKFKVVPVDIRWHTLEEQIKFPQILNQENLDLMHFPYFSVPIGYKKPFVITIHDLILNHFSTGKASTLPLPFYQLKRFGYKYVLSQAVKNSKKIIVPLNAVRDDLTKTLNVKEEKVVVTHEGFDEKIISKDKSLVDSATYFLYVGNAYPHKNLERLIEAFTELRKKEKNIELLLVGKDDYFYKKLREKVKKENLSGITFQQNVSDAQLGNLYKNALAVVLPSLMEGFGLPALEAMASSCLVVASDIPSFKEVCQEAAVYFDPYSISNIKEKISFAYNLDKKVKEDYIKKGLERVKQFSWKKMARQTLKVYESSIGLR